MEETQRMTLNELAQVHQPAQLFRSRRNVDGHDGITGFCGGQEMAYRADSADPGSDAGHFGKRATFAKLFKPAEFHHMKLGIGNLPRVIEEDADLGVSLNTKIGR